MYVCKSIQDDGTAAVESIKITFIGRNSGQYEIRVKASDTIDHVKERLWMFLHSDLSIDRATFERDFLGKHHLMVRGGKVLDDISRTLSDYNITTGAVIQMSGLGPKGGMPGQKRVTTLVSLSNISLYVYFDTCLYRYSMLNLN